MILGFSGYRHQVMPLLQNLSHATRAFNVNASGLPGFVIEFNIINYLILANQNGNLEHAKKWQVVDIHTLCLELGTKTNEKGRMNFLDEAYPGLYVQILTHLN